MPYSGSPGLSRPSLRVAVIQFAPQVCCWRRVMGRKIRRLIIVLFKPVSKDRPRSAEY